MKKRYLLEAASRPIVEFHSTMLALLMAVFVWLFQYYLFMPPVISGATVLLLVGYAIWRLKDALRLRYYQKHLTILPRYFMKRSKIPVSKKHLFLGKGFEWKQKHTQRLRDTLLPANDHFLEDKPSYRKARRIEKACENRAGLRWLSVLLSKDRWWNPVRPKPPVGGVTAIHGVELLEREINIDVPLGERVGHTLVLGTTRVGKTRLAEILITQDIRRGDTVIVFDPKGDAELLQSLYVSAMLAGRLNDFYVFHLAYPEVSARYNPIGA